MRMHIIAPSFTQTKKMLVKISVPVYNDTEILLQYCSRCRSSFLVGVGNAPVNRRVVKSLLHVCYLEEGASLGSLIFPNWGWYHRCNIHTQSNAETFFIKGNCTHFNTNDAIKDNQLLMMTRMNCFLFKISH